MIKRFTLFYVLHERDDEKYNSDYKPLVESYDTLQQARDEASKIIEFEEDNFIVGRIYDTKTENYWTEYPLIAPGDFN